jgi:uncharacterized OB-fold protein
MTPTHADDPTSRSGPAAAVRPSSFTVPYWTASRDGRLLVQYSQESQSYQFFPMPTSLQGRTRALQWRDVEPKGEVFAFTVSRLSPPRFRGQEPYVVAVVELDVGVRMLTNIVDCDPEQVTIGMRVVGTWAPLDDGTQLLRFRPA